LPRKENQVRPLTKLSPELQIQIWQEAVESSPNGIPTGAAIKRLVEERFPSDGSGRTPKDTASELEKLRSDNQRLRQQIRDQNKERDRRAAAVALELEQLRAENRQLKAELRQRDRDWEVRLAAERVKIRAEVIAELREEIRAEVKAEYEGQINSLTQQLAEMTANYHAVLARLTALEAKGK
jgi:chromosome segregation ATPase